MSAPTTRRQTGWHIEVVTKDEAGKDLILKRYKPFRLTALRLDPQSFGSNLAREEAFDDEVWTSRLMDPLNRVIVAIDDTTADIVCAAFLRELSRETESDSSESRLALLFAIYGVWTLPSARRHGIALAVLEETKRLAGDIAKVEGRECRLEVHAYEHNIGAVKLYSKAGFVALEPVDSGLLKLVLTL
ncbi:hypothetical protein CC79DRAFT_1336661 [Sarocladium strictum]